MAKLTGIDGQSDAYKAASLRYVVDADRKVRMGARLAELDSVYEVEIRRLSALMNSAKKLFGKK